jgi:hypothetical protein
MPYNIYNFGHAMTETSRISFFFLLLTTCLLLSCNNDITRQLEAKGVALGKMNEIVVISDESLWEGMVGDTFRFYFQSAYPILPTPEPLFDLRHFTVQDLEAQPLRKELRSYVILANLNDEESPTTKMVKKDLGDEKFYRAKNGSELSSSVGKDKWARNQVLFYLFSSSHDELAESIKKHFPAIARRVNEHDEKQLKSSIYVDRINNGLSTKVNQLYGLDIDVPGEYQVALERNQENLLWLRKDTPEAIMNLVFRKVPYRDAGQLSMDNAIRLRNEFGASYVTADEEGDNMVVNNDDLPVYEYTLDIDGRYAKEFRGVWEMTKSFAGGPFITYLIVDEKKNELIYADVFVLAPGSEKRNMMMQLDYIIKSSSFTQAANL